MKVKIDGILVVEGSGDASFLSSFIDTDIYITNGYDMPKHEIEFLKLASNNNKVIILTDSDEAGKLIRSRLHECLNCYDAVVDISKCNKNDKHGVAECDKDEVLRVLEKYIDNQNITKSKIPSNFIYTRCLDNDEFYLFLEKKFCIKSISNKGKIKRLNTLKLTEKYILEEFERYKNGNQ